MSGPPRIETEPLELDDYDFALPPAQIAQQPPAERDLARLFVLDRARGPAADAHARVRDLADFLRAGDLLVVNTTRVLPARLRGHKHSGGAAEALLLGAVDSPSAPPARPRFRALLRCSGRLREGLRLRFARDGESLDARVCALRERGEVELEFAPGPSPYTLGEMPLPPYIERPCATSLEAARDRERYQTVFAREPGAVAAPTAGLHLTSALLEKLAAGGVEQAEVVLHVGPGTFRPIEPSDLAAGRLHREAIALPEATAQAVARTRSRGGRVVAVGTTTTRVLESRADARGALRPGTGTTDLLLRPGSCFRVVDALLTNFHLPRSSLLLLVAAFAGRERVLAAYREALARGYRFYSYGDAMLLL